MKPELVCPAGNLPSLKAAVDAGGDAVYMGFRNASNARNFEGLNFNRDEASAGIDYAHANGVRVFVAVNTSSNPEDNTAWTSSIDMAAELGADAVILADIGLLAYARDHYKTQVEIEIFVSGGLCVMAEGRCWLSSYITGDSPNMHGVCSPAHAVRFEEEGGTLEVRLDGLLVNRFAPGEAAAYPTLCKGCFEAGGMQGHVMEDPYSLNVLEMLPEIFAAGVQGLKIEGRQRGKHYVREVVSTLRRAVDACADNPDIYRVRPEWMASLDAMSEGGGHTSGAYVDEWR